MDPALLCACLVGMAARRAAASGAGGRRDSEEGAETGAKTIGGPDKAVDFFRRLLNDTVTSDLEIEVKGGAKFHAHRAVLAARSDDLRDELSGTMSEAKAVLKVRSDLPRLVPALLLGGARRGRQAPAPRRRTRATALLSVPRAAPGGGRASRWQRLLRFAVSEGRLPLLGPAPALLLHKRVGLRRVQRRRSAQACGGARLRRF
jgi:hypothetical protein